MLTEQASNSTEIAPVTQQLADRQRMWAQINALNDALLSQASATAVLQALCDRRDGASPPIRARKLRIPEVADDLRAVRRELDAADDEPVCHRRVELTCGDVVLSHADNWYLPNRLSDEMNRRLLATEAPFGVVVAALAFERCTLSSEVLFDPLSTGCDAHTAHDPRSISSTPEHVLQHRAILRTPDGKGFSLLLETYTKQIFMP